MGCHHPNQDGQNHQPGISNISRPKFSDLPNDGMRWFRILRGFGIRPGLHRIVNGLSICYWRGYLSRFVLSCCFFLQFIWKNTGWQHLGFSLFLRLKTMVRSFLVKSTCFVGKLWVNCWWHPSFAYLKIELWKKLSLFPFGWWNEILMSIGPICLQVKLPFCSKRHFATSNIFSSFATMFSQHISSFSSKVPKFSPKFSSFPHFSRRFPKFSSRPRGEAAVALRGLRPRVTRVGGHGSAADGLQNWGRDGEEVERGGKQRGGVGWDGVLKWTD